MTVDTAAMDALARRLLRRQADRLTASELDAVLSWLSGGQRHGALQLCVTLGRPQNEPETVAALYQLLDRQLLGAGRLDAHAAHLADRDLPQSERKARFRRLIQAFHPDCHPHLSAWLTPRAQLIHQSYAAFKLGEPWPAAPPTQAAPSAAAKADGKPGSNSAVSPQPEHPWQPGPFRHSARLVPNRAGPLRWLLIRLGRSPRMAGVVVGAVAVVILAPLLLVYLADERSGPGNPALVTAAPAAPEAPPAEAIHPGAAASVLAEQHLARRVASVDVVNAASPDPAGDSRPLEPARQDDPVAGPAALAPEPLAARAEIELLLQRLGRYVSSGNNDALAQLMDRSAADDARAGMAEHYSRIIAGSRRRHQEFRILSIEHQPPDSWTVQALSRLTMAFDDLTARHEEGRYQVIIRQAEDGQLRITGFDG